MFRNIITAAAIGSTGLAGAAHAQNAAPVEGYVHLGVAHVDQADKATLFAGGAEVPDAGFSTKGRFTAALEAGVFVYDGIAVSASAMLPVETPNTAAGSLEGLGNLGDEEVGFATATVHYHFNRDGVVSPYLGGGLSYMYVTGTDDGVVTGLEIDNAFGAALQAGVDVRVSGSWTVFADAKKLFIDTDARGNLGGAAITAEATVDPWIFQAGIGFRF